MRRTYVQDPQTGKFVLKEKYQRLSRQAPDILPDIEPFRSPIDQTIVSSRPHLREHNARHGVAQMGEYGENDGQAFFTRAERERQLRLQGQTPEQRRERLETIIPIVIAHEK